MEGVTNFAMRLWLYLAGGPRTLATPFLRVTATYPARILPPEFAPELGPLAGIVPYTLVPQLMAAEEQDFLRAAELLLPLTPFIDLNCGCPSPTCVGKGAGSSMLREPDALRATAEMLIAGVGAGRLGVKMRTGFHTDGEFPRLLGALADLPLARLTVHGRTRPAGYTGAARWDLIALAARTTRAPVIASGDVVDLASLRARLELAPAVAGVIVGRGALRNPWLFRELAAGVEQAGVEQALDMPTLRRALAVFAMLHELGATGLDDLVGLVADGLAEETAGTDLARWDQVYRRVALALHGRVVDPDGAALAGAWPLERPTIGRLKLVWNYLRSSLPAAFFAPALMRSGDLGTLLEGINLIHKQAGAPERLPLRYTKTLDWLYSGGRREPPSASDGAARDAAALKEAPSGSSAGRFGKAAEHSAAGL
jgi:tRNA-dihydrouridine synthase